MSFNTLCDEESRIFLQTTVSTQQGCNIGLNYGFIRNFLTFLGNTRIWILQSTISNNDFQSQTYSKKRTKGNICDTYGWLQIVPIFSFGNINTIQPLSNSMKFTINFLNYYILH